MSDSAPAPPAAPAFHGRWLLVAASFVVVVAGLRAAAPVMLPVLFALFLALLSFPIVDWLRRLGARRSLAVLMTVVLVIGALSVFGYVMSGAFADFARAAPRYAEMLIERVRVALDGLRERGINVSAWLAVERIDPGSLFDVAGNVVGGTVRGVATFVSFATLVLLILICMLYEGFGLGEKLRRALGAGTDSESYLFTVTRDVQRYLGVKTLVSLATGVLLGLWAWLLDIPFPVVLGLIAFLLNYIPAIGSILAAVPAVLLALLQFGLGRAALAAGGYLLVNFLIGNLLEPLMMGRRFGLSTLAVFLSLIFWGWVWGPLGMLLSVPLTMAIKISLEGIPDLRWAAALLGPVPPAIPIPAEPEPAVEKATTASGGEGP